MSNLSTESTNPQPMPVIAYAPVVDDRSMNRLFRLAMGWFLILAFAIAAMTEFVHFAIMFYRNPGFTVDINMSMEPIYLGIMLLRTATCAGLASGGIPILRRTKHAIAFTRLILICNLICMVLFSSISFVLTAMRVSSLPQRMKMEMVINQALYIPSSALLPLFLILLTSPRIAAIYK